MAKSLEPQKTIHITKEGGHLAFVVKVATTPKADSSVKVVECPKYKTLCQALAELGAIEAKSGTEKFCRDIVDVKALFTEAKLAFNHNPITGGGDPADPSVEDTEFKNPDTPLVNGAPMFFDTEYIEVGYALERQGFPPDAAMLLWVGVKRTIGGVASTGEVLSNSVDWAKAGGPLSDHDVKVMPDEFFPGTGVNHPPNANGLALGRHIAQNYKSIDDFVKFFCFKERNCPK